MRAVNLIPQDQRGGAKRGAGRSQGGAYAVLGVLGGLALLALVYGVAAHQVSTRTAKLASVEAQAQQAQASAAQLAPYAGFLALREQRVGAVNQLVNSRFDWAHAFHEFGRVLPPEVSITSISGTIASTGTSGTGASATSANSTTGPSSSGGVQPSSGASSATGAAAGTVASATPPGSVPTFALSGCAINQSSVALTLERLRLMDGVSSVSLQSSTKSVGSGTSGGGACPASYPVFNAQITFDALPASSIPTGSGTAKAAKLSGGA